MKNLFYLFTFYSSIVFAQTAKDFLINDNDKIYHTSITEVIAESKNYGYNLFRNNKGEWIDAIAGEDEIVVNVGDMLERLTNNQLKSTTHRVVNPPREKWDTPRFSIPFFLHPRNEMKLDCLPSCVKKGEQPQYDPITAEEFLNQRLAEIRLK